METPLDTVNLLVRAINAGDLKTAVELYEPEAVLVVRPGQVARGWAQLHEALAGRHPLAPTISPKKSWEGFAGSVLFCMAVGVACVVLALHGPWWTGLVAGAAAAVGARAR